MILQKQIRSSGGSWVTGKMPHQDKVSKSYSLITTASGIISYDYHIVVAWFYVCLPAFCSQGSFEDVLARLGTFRNWKTLRWNFKAAAKSAQSLLLVLWELLRSEMLFGSQSKSSQRRNFAGASWIGPRDWQPRELSPRFPTELGSACQDMAPTLNVLLIWRIAISFGVSTEILMVERPRW